MEPRKEKALSGNKFKDHGLLTEYLGMGWVGNIREDPLVKCHQLRALFPGGAVIKLQIFQDLLQVLPNSLGPVTIRELKLGLDQLENPEWVGISSLRIGLVCRPGLTEGFLAEKGQSK